MILFLDLDDTLVPSSRAYDHGLLQIGLKPDDKRFLQARAEVKAICPTGYPASRSRRLYFKRYLELGAQFSPKRHLEMVAGYENAVNAYLAKAWLELGRTELIKELRKRVRKVGLVTNETLTAQIGKLHGIDPDWTIFDFMITSEEVGVEKPHPVLFRRALDLAGATADETLMVGDNPTMDVGGARALGMRAVLTTEFLQPSESTFGPMLKKLDELPVYIDRLLALS